MKSKGVAKGCACLPVELEAAGGRVCGDPGPSLSVVFHLHSFSAQVCFPVLSPCVRNNSVDQD